MKLYGTATLDETSTYWYIECEPQVRMRLKHVFHKIDAKSTRGILRLSNNDQNCRDLEWFATRYPLKFNRPDVLVARARAFDDQQINCRAILEGHRELPPFRMAVPPREYQRRAAALLIECGGLLLVDDFGLGKTCTGICGMAASSGLPALVVCPVHLQRQWIAQLQKFAPHLLGHIIKQTRFYDVSDKKTGQVPDVLVCSYSKLCAWAPRLAGQLKYVVYDEIQELRHPTSAKWQAAQQISESTPRRLGLSATPIYNYGGEFYSVLACLRPEELGSKEEFMREWCIDSTDARKAQIKEPRVFASYLRDNSLMLRRTRADVKQELPACTKILHTVSSDTKPFENVESAATELAKIIMAQGGGFEKMRAASEFSTTMRQATGIAKAIYVAEFVRILIESGQPVTLFGWHRAVYDLWAEYLKDLNPVWYTGTESESAKARSIAAFTGGDTNLLVMSLRSGAGVDGLQTRCSTAVFGELDWSPGAMDQCVCRFHRPGQSDPVFAYYLAADDGADPYMIDVLGLKREQSETVLDPDAALIESLEVDPNHVRKLAEAYLARKKNA